MPSSNYIDSNFSAIDEADEQEAQTRREEAKRKILEKRQSTPSPPPVADVAPANGTPVDQGEQSPKQRRKPGPKPGCKRGQRRPKIKCPVGKDKGKSPGWRQLKAASLGSLVQFVNRFGGFKRVRTALNELEKMLR